MTGINGSPGKDVLFDRLGRFNWFGLVLFTLFLLLVPVPGSLPHMSHGHSKVKMAGMHTAVTERSYQCSLCLFTTKNLNLLVEHDCAVNENGKWISACKIMHHKYLNLSILTLWY